MDSLKPREPLLAVMFTAMLAGLGQIYAHRIKRGILFLCISILFTIVMTRYSIYLIKYIFDPNTSLSLTSIAFFLIPHILVFGFVIFVVIDAYRCAKIYNLDNNLTRSISSGRRILLIAGIVFLGFILNPFTIVENKIIGIDASSYYNNLKMQVQTFKIPNETMKPTLLAGDLILVDKKIYKKSEPKRGDVIIFLFPEDLKKMFVKRLIGLPGETIEIKNGSILINGTFLKEPLFVDKYYYNKGDYAKEGEAVKIPENSYFVLGDNTAFSQDSRYFGFVPKTYLVGKAYKIYYPFNRSGPIK